MQIFLRNQLTKSPELCTVYFSYSGTDTTAELVKIDENAGCIETNIKATASLYYKDKIYSKIKGRKVALAKLLKRMNETSAGDKKPEFKLTKVVRTMIWQEYFKTHRKV